MINKFQIYAAVFLTALLSPSHAAPLEIELSTARHTTIVHASSWVPPDLGGGMTNYSRTMVSSVPYSDSLSHDVYGSLEATADASLFQVTAFTAAERRDYLRRGSQASAKTEVTFSPVATGLSTLSLEFFGGGEWFYSDGFASLFDVTANQTLWNYAWEGHAGTVPWVSASDGWTARATLVLETDFNAAHDYELILFTQVHSQAPDTELIQIQLSGLSAVTVIPEPSAITLTGLGIVLLAVKRRRPAAA